MTIKDTPLGIDTSILGFIASVTWDQGATLSTGEVAEMSSSLDLANCEKETYIQNILQKVCTSRDFLKQCLLVSFSTACPITITVQPCPSFEVCTNLRAATLSPKQLHHYAITLSS